MRTLSPEEKLKLTQVIDEGIKVLTDISYLKEGLKETVDAVAEQLDSKPTLINKAIKTAYKMDLGEQQNTLSEVEDLLVNIGKKVS